jgi:hypothetical protein
MLDLLENPSWVSGGAEAFHRERRHNLSFATFQSSDQRVVDEVRAMIASRGIIQHANHMLVYAEKKMAEISSPQLRTEIRAELDRWLREYMR